MPSVLIAGGGLVGSVNACFFGKRRWNVIVYESRSDPRGKENEKGKSINLALGFRALSTLETLGLKEKVIEMGVAVKEKIRYEERKLPVLEKLRGLNEGDFILTINRHKLCQFLINEAEKYQNVKFNFNTKATIFDTEKHILIVDAVDGQIHAKGDLILACDGAHSSIRRSLLKVSGFGFNQKYIDIGYMDLSLNVHNSSDLKPGIHYSWRTNDLIVVALVNRDQSLTGE
uniref:FAD_binding_3 domain-containing protein n=1 Tax=Caenorhabditis tropicalis TaxID=1561998 RepID=A0A1I7TP20_9PELO